MTIRLRDLTAAQVRMLAFLDDGFDAEDTVGRELSEMIVLRGNPFRIADDLVKLGLIELRIGPSVTHAFSAWYRLTLLGRQVRDEGVA